jgi:hypothetical protein
MRPHTKNAPTGLAQSAIGQAVSRSVSGDFVFPIRPIVVRHPKMPAAAVPEASVNEDSEAFAAKDEIRASWQRLVSPPASNPVCAENCDQFQLSACVSFRADCSHYPRAFFSGENVCHKVTLAERMDAPALSINHIQTRSKA